MPAGCWTGSPAPTRPSSPAATPTWPPPAAGFPRPPAWTPPWPCWRSTATSAGSTPTPPAPRAAGRPRRGSWSTLCHAPQNPHNLQNPCRQPVLWVLWVLWRVAAPQGAADAGHGGCHVIQRERPQPLPAICTPAAPADAAVWGRLRPPAGPFCSPRPLPSDEPAVLGLRAHRVDLTRRHNDRSPEREE